MLFTPNLAANRSRALVNISKNSRPFFSNTSGRFRCAKGVNCFFLPFVNWKAILVLNCGFKSPLSLPHHNKTLYEYSFYSTSIEWQTPSNINNTFIALRFFQCPFFLRQRERLRHFFSFILLPIHCRRGERERGSEKKRKTIKEKWYNKNVSFHCVLQFGKEGKAMEKWEKSEVLREGFCCFFPCCFDISSALDVCQQKYKYTTRYLGGGGKNTREVEKYCGRNREGNGEVLREKFFSFFFFWFLTNVVLLKVGNNRCF